MDNTEIKYFVGDQEFTSFDDALETAKNQGFRTVNREIMVDGEPLSFQGLCVDPNCKCHKRWTVVVF